MLRVLVADDDPGIVRTLMLGLKMMGCQPVGVESAEAAIKALEDKSADLLLTDMRMEGMSGVDLVRDAHARWPEMICVVMTAFASYENAVSAIKAGAYDYLPKPFTTEQLEHLIRKVEMLVDLQRENSRLRAGSGDWFDGLTYRNARLSSPLWSGSPRAMPQCSCPARRDRARPSWLGPSIEDRHVRTSRLWK